MFYHLNASNIFLQLTYIINKKHITFQPVFRLA